MRQIILLSFFLFPLIFFGQHKLFLENQSTGKTIKIKKQHSIVCFTLADKSFSGDLKNLTSTSLTLKVRRPSTNNKNVYMDTVISFADISRLKYTKHKESGFIDGLSWYGAILGPFALIGGTVTAFSNDDQDKQAGFILIGAGILLTSGAIYSIMTSGPTEYDLVTDWKIKTK